jgi:2-polyprenyl-6-methoxyphenol hydroxylase-like FAD-dependent oxidoreductase
VLPFNAVRELNDLEILNQLHGQYYKASTITYCKPSGKAIKSADLTEAPFENDQFIALKRQDLNHALLDGLEKKIRYNTEIQTVEHGDDSVKITCTNELLNGSYDLLIAADGINSIIRQKNYEGQEMLHDHNVICWRFIVPFPDHNLQPLHMAGQTDLFTIYPVSDEELYCYGHVYEDLNDISLGENAVENIKKVFSGYGGPVPYILSQISDVEILTNRLKSVVKPCFFDRRIAFVGDSANGCSPLIQQGAALALADSRCLADALAMQNVDQALATYQERRERKVERTIRFSDAPLSHLQNMQSWLSRGIRDLKIRAMGPPDVIAWKRIATDRFFLN